MLSGCLFFFLISLIAKLLRDHIDQYRRLGTMMLSVANGFMVLSRFQFKNLTFYCLSKCYDRDVHFCCPMKKTYLYICLYASSV